MLIDNFLEEITDYMREKLKNKGLPKDSTCCGISIHGKWADPVWLIRWTNSETGHNFLIAKNSKNVLFQSSYSLIRSDVFISSIEHLQELLDFIAIELEVEVQC